MLGLSLPTVLTIPSTSLHFSTSKQCFLLRDKTGNELVVPVALVADGNCDRAEDRKHNFMIDFDIPGNASVNIREIGGMMKAVEESPCLKEQMFSSEELLKEGMALFQGRTEVNAWVSLKLHTDYITKLLYFYAKSTKKEATVTSHMVMKTTENIVGLHNYIAQHILHQNRNKVSNNKELIAIGTRVYLEMVTKTLEDAFSNTERQPAFAVCAGPTELKGLIVIGLFRCKLTRHMENVLATVKPQLAAIGASMNETRYWKSYGEPE